MCNAEEINRSFLMRKEGYFLFFLLLMIAETTVVYSIRFLFPSIFLPSFFEKGIVGLRQKLASLRSDSQFAAEKDVVRLRILLSLSV